MKGTKKKKEILLCSECGMINLTDREKETMECEKCGMEICTQCGGLIKFEYENNGFQAPDPTHYEVSGGQCINCGHKLQI